MASDISVRQWQELYRTGAFAQDDDDARELAGWDDFNDPLADRKVQALAKLVMGITHPFILDEYRIYFVEHHPGQGPRYGSVRFRPITGEMSERGTVCSNRTLMQLLQQRNHLRRLNRPP